jgi:hypothetical protein
MTFFDKLKQAAGQIADGASRQVDLLKLQSELGNVETQMERQYAEAGRRARELYRRKLILDSEMDVLMQRIDGYEAQVMELREQVQAVQQGAGEQHAEGTPAAPAPPPAQGYVPATPAAPAPVPAVPAAGPVYQPPMPAAPPPPAEAAPVAPPPAPAPAPAEQAVLCPECGKQVPESAKFCLNCGHRLEG